MAQVVFQRGSISVPAVSASESIQLGLVTNQAEFIKQVSGNTDNLCVEQRVRSAEGLDAELVELPLAALLRPLVAEHRAGVEPLLEWLGLVDLVLEVGPDHGRGAFRTKTVGLGPALEREHSLFHNVRRLTDVVEKDLHVLENGESNLGVSVPGEDLARFVFDCSPGSDLFRKDIVNAGGGPKFHGTLVPWG